jgi:hypothetical protein
MKSSTFVIHKKHLDENLHSNTFKCLKKTFVEKLVSFELCWKPLYRNSIYMFIETLDEKKKNCPQTNTKCTIYYCVFTHIKQLKSLLNTKSALKCITRGK